MNKILAATLAAILLNLTPLPVQASTLMADEMTTGTWTTNPRYITFGSYNGNPMVWRVLEVKDSDSDFNGTKTAFLLLDNLLMNSDGNTEMTRFDSSNNSFPNSVLKEWLNDGERGFLAGLGAFQADMLDTIYGPDNGHRRWSGGRASGTSKVFLLSLREANNKNYFKSDTDRAAKGSWWLRSPGFGDDIATSVLHFGGVAGNGPYVYGMSGIRPALKINLSPSSVFSTVSVSYGLSVKTDDGDNPIKGAKVSLAPSKEVQSAEKFSNSLGITGFTNVEPGAYIITVSKPGYITKSEKINVPGTPSISLAPDPAALPGKVKFGKYKSVPIEWDVLEIVDGRAHLFAGALFQMNFDTRAGSNVWADSSLRAHLNSNNTGGFLQEANFTAAEAAAIDAAASATGDSVYLLSNEEVYSYLPDANMRYFDDDKAWLTRTPGGDDMVELISPDGEYGGGIPAYTRNILGWVRPAIWVDLSMLTYDFGSNTLLPYSIQPEEVP